MTPDEEFMSFALGEARKGLGHTSPNPAVGAVLVKSGRVLARGFHRAAGLPHAEVEALRKRTRAAGATLYVTLEPCSSYGRTPPCVEAITAARVARVVVGAIDPNPRHAGRGVELLRAAGIDVTAGVLESECRNLNAAFNKWIISREPLVIAKAAMSLDGRITLSPQDGRWLSSERSRAHAHRLRAQVDAILVGGETVRTDNPRLTVRGVAGARQPWRVVVTRSGNMPPDAHVFTDEHREKTLVFTGLPLRKVLRELGRREITSVLIEGGMRVLGEAFDRRLVDQMQFYVAPIICAGPKAAVGGRGAGASIEAPLVVEPQYERIGSDLCLTGAVQYPALAQSAGS